MLVLLLFEVYMTRKAVRTLLCWLVALAAGTTVGVLVGHNMLKHNHDLTALWGKKVQAKVVRTSSTLDNTNIDVGNGIDHTYLSIYKVQVPDATGKLHIETLYSGQDYSLGDAFSTYYLAGDHWLSQDPGFYKPYSWLVMGLFVGAIAAMVMYIVMLVITIPMAKKRKRSRPTTSPRSSSTRA